MSHIIFQIAETHAETAKDVLLNSGIELQYDQNEVVIKQLKSNIWVCHYFSLTIESHTLHHELMHELIYILNVNDIDYSFDF
jgi:hypothetical protein